MPGWTSPTWALDRWPCCPKTRTALRERSATKFGSGLGKPAVIVSDSFGRPWRVGTVDVAVGVSGLKSIKDERGLTDRYGYQLKAAVAAVADEIAAAAELVMGKGTAFLSLLFGAVRSTRRKDR